MDKYELQSIATNDPDPEVRKAAVNRLSVSSSIFTDSRYHLESISENDRNDTVREVAKLKLSGKPIPDDLLKSPAELEREKKERLRIICIQAKKEGIDVCMNCLTIKPPRCSYCNACIECVGGYSTICYRCYDDDDD